MHNCFILRRMASPAAAISSLRTHVGARSVLSVLMGYISVLSWLLQLLSPHDGWAQANAKPDLYLLAIGTSDYHDPAIPDLQYADDDAASLVRWAETQKGHLYAQVYTRLLTNQEATRTKSIEAILEHFRAARPQDQLLLFLSGHGVVEPSARTWHFLTTDSQLTSVAGTALEQDDILNKLESQGKRNRLLVLVDSCQSGALADAIPKDGKGLFVAGDVTPLDDGKASTREGMWAIFTAGSSLDKAVEGPDLVLPTDGEDIKGHGLFTWAILRALQGSGADRDGSGVVTLNEFQSFVASEVRLRSGGKQLPVISGRLTDTGLGFVPGTVEKCDGIDNDLNGQTDEGFDKNRNGLGDCLESERCNGIDDNGDGQVDEGFDLDGDGHRDRELCGLTFGADCDDRNIAIHPGQKDWSNLRDDDCDGLYDEDDLSERWNPQIPDHIEAKHRLSRGIGVGSLGTSLLLLGGGMLQWHGMKLESARAVQDGVITQMERSSISQSMTVGTVLVGAGVVGLGVSGHFSWQARHIRMTLYPMERKRH